MPELPDVEVYRRHLSATGLRRTVADVRVRDARMLRQVRGSQLRRRLTGRRLLSTRRHGKHLFARISGGGWLVMHFGMTGRLDHMAADDELPQHTRVSVRFGDGTAVHLVDQRRLGFVALTDDPARYAEQEDLGPDALALRRTEFTHVVRSYGGAVKAALMDQSLIAGIGNVYSDEILFHARVDPRTRTTDLDARALNRLHTQTARVLNLAADRGADPERVPRTWLLPHREDGAPCPRGRGTVRKFRLSGRGAFYCAECQAG